MSFVSFTVPQYQRQESYFAPLTGLTADPGTELNFALMPYHSADQEPGTTGDQVRLIDAALAARPGGSRAWGICTECGMAVWTGKTSRSCWTCTARSSLRARRSCWHDKERA
jgi:hypothetical protein